MDKCFLEKVGFLAKPKKILNADILIIDDCKLQQVVASRLLTELGLTSVCANSVGAALPYTASLNHNQLIISDIELTDGLGIDFIKIVRSADKNNQIKSIAMSSNPKYKNAALKAGFNVFIDKPLIKESLQKALTDIEFISQQHMKRELK